MSQQSQGGAPSVPVLLATHLVLVVTTLAVLYPVLWVLKMALTPSQAFSMDPMPSPAQMSF